MGESTTESTTNLHQALSSSLLSNFSQSDLKLSVASDNCTWNLLSTTKHLSSMECSSKNKEKASLFTVVRENFTSVLEEKNSQVKRLKETLERSTGIKDIELRRLHKSIASLESQLSDRLRQIEVLQEAGRLKDQHIQLLKKVNEELYGNCKKEEITKGDGSYGKVISQLEVQLLNKNQRLEEVERQVLWLQQELEHTRQNNLQYSERISRKLGSNTTEEGDVNHPNQPADVPISDDKNNHFCECCPNIKVERSVQTEHSSTITQDALAKVVLELKDTQELLEARKDELNEAAITVRDLRQEKEEKRRLCADQTILIKELRLELTNKVLELEIKFLQDAISDKDTSLALLEMSTLFHQQTFMKAIQREKMKLMEELRTKIQKKSSLFDTERNTPSHSVFAELCTQDQACEAIRVLDTRRANLIEQIDKMLAVVLEENPSLLEGLPRIQQNMGMRPDIAQVASLPELIEELQEEEEDVSCLQNYAANLLQRIMKQSPLLLNKLEFS